MNIDDMGSAYSYRHAAVLAEQLPISSRVKSPENEYGLNTMEIMANIIEYDLRVISWQNANLYSDRKGEFPKPFFDMGSAEERGEAMDIDSLREMLSMERTEVPEDGQ